MISQIRKVLKSDKGDASHIDTAVLVMVLMICIVTAINVYALFVQHSRLDYFAREMVVAAAAAGDTNAASVQARYNMLAAEVGFSPTMTWSAGYLTGTRVQYGDPLQVTLTVNVSFSGLGIAADIPIPIHARYSGISQRYWK